MAKPLTDGQTSHRWQNLSQMAINIFSISSISSEAESIFSLAGLLLTNRRDRLLEDIMEAHEGLGSWDRAGVIRIGQHKEVNSAYLGEVLNTSQETLVDSGESQL